MTTGRALLLLGLLCVTIAGTGVHADDGDEPPWERRRREAQDRAGGVPQEILDRQRLGAVVEIALTEAERAARAAADAAAAERIDLAWHEGRRLRVPAAFPTIQAAIEAAEAGDTVVVSAGIYYELIAMKDGVKLVSDDVDAGNEPVAVEGAKLRLPRRTLRTVLDGSKSEPSHHGLIDFVPGTGAHTIVDGFTIQNLPRQDHHLPGHAHALNIRGASPVILNCLIRNNGSTGIGNHVVYEDQGRPIAERDFRASNVKHEARATIYHNVIHASLGRGIGCNHLSAPWILGNEVFDNDDSELGEPGPGIGMKHGAAPHVIGNVVRDNPGGGIMGRVGEPQGAHPVDRPPRPTIHRNVVYGNGEERPAISCLGGGSTDEPVRITGNFVLSSGAVGIGLTGGSVGILEDNFVSATRLQGVAIDASTALRLNGNAVTGTGGPGFVIARGARVLEMKGNAADRNEGPRFVLRGGTIEGP